MENAILALYAIGILALISLCVYGIGSWLNSKHEPGHGMRFGK